MRVKIKGVVIDTEGNEQEADIEMFVNGVSGSGDTVRISLTTDGGDQIGECVFIQRPPFEAFPYRKKSLPQEVSVTKQDK